MKKLIVTVAPASNFQGKDANPALPYSPEEVAEATYEAWNEGASIVHIHGRDAEGLPTNDPGFFQEADRLIREKNCDIILQHSMAPANPFLLGKDIADIDDGLRTSTTTPPPEMVSLEIAPCIIVWGGKAVPFNWNRLWAEKAAANILERGIVPEIEIYNNGQMDDLDYLIGKKLLKKPYYVSFVMNMHRVGSGFMRYSPRHVMHLVDLLPPDSVFSVLGVGYPAEFEATTLSILLGGNVRVGFEDNIHIEKGKLAKNSAELVAKIVRIAKELGREIASPAEAREMLGIPKLKE
jgi:3-keto-5-aminohexanoate cleavage enzyme